MNKISRKEPIKIAVFGGSFDPPHSAHVMVAGYLLSNFDFESVWVIPCFRHPFGKKTADFNHRIKMCKLAFSCFMRGLVKVMDIEKESGGVSYTVNTLKTLKRRYPNHSFTLVAGSDIIAEKDKWKDFDEIEKIASVIFLNRDGFLSDLSNYSTVFFPNISSSMIRQKISCGEDVDHLVPSKVRSYIKKNNLYGIKE